jgi:phage-related holin
LTLFENVRERADCPAIPVDMMGIVRNHFVIASKLLDRIDNTKNISQDGRVIFYIEMRIGIVANG